MSTPEGVAARNFVNQWLGENGRENGLILRTVKDKKEKYGRYLGDLYPADGDGLSLVWTLLSAGHGVEYTP